eukprot:COSAG04_NODE_1427_length_6801_cov_3.862131_4_plen_269_part_00
MPAASRLHQLRRHLGAATPSGCPLLTPGPRPDGAAAGTPDGRFRASDVGELASALTPEQVYEFDIMGYTVCAAHSSPPPCHPTHHRRRWQILRQHYSPESVQLFNEAIDEVQKVPVTFDAYNELGLAPGGAPGEPWRDPKHAAWHGRTLLGPEARPQNRVDNIICGTDKLDSIVRDHKMKEIHKVTTILPSVFSRCAHVAHTPPALLAGAVLQELAGGACMLSATYYIERHGPCDAGGLHHGGFPKMRTFRARSPLSFRPSHFLNREL